MNKNKARQFIHTKRVDESGAWYGLDNAGVIMPAVTDSINTGLFRLEFQLTAPVDPDLLNRALTDCSNRFPYFNVKLKRGFFWYYLDQCTTSPRVYSDQGSPCQGWNINKRGTRMFRIRVQGDRLAGEFSHALTDGSGAVSFMKSLLVRYFELLGIEAGAELGQGEYADILSVDSPVPPEEYEDAYQRYFPGSLPGPEANPKAWHLSGELLPRGSYRIIVGTLKLSEILNEAKKRNVTLTGFLGAVYLDALQSLWFAQSKKPRKRFISVEIPVNLRQFFSSRTNRNFSLFFLLRENLDLGARSFDELVKRSHHRMKIEGDPKSLAMQIARNAGGTRNPVVRAIPLFIKDIAGRILFSVLGESMLSGFISNLGVLRLPPGIAPQVKAVVI
ncbi:MAG: hypothetical protein RBT73_00515, partial [Spirochaetia bacterium]|nr:hypothetical protein [Spirochaetia bacterium]